MRVVWILFGYGLGLWVGVHSHTLHDCCHHDHKEITNAEATQGVIFDVPVKNVEEGCTLITTDESGIHLTTVAVECPQ